MYKIVGLVAALFVLTTGFSKAIIREAMVVKSDVFKMDVPRNKCRIIGVAYSGNPEIPISGATIAEYSSQRLSYTNRKGEFELLVNPTDSVLYFFHPSYGEFLGAAYDFKGGHEITVAFIAGPQRVILEEPVIADKPVIYMYADTEMTADVELVPKGEFTFTYPAYNSGWNVSLNKQGMQVENKSYPYLFWEGNVQIDFVREKNDMEGYFIDTDSTISFLEHQLTAFGFNATEKADFITFWGPRLTKDKYATVQFFFDQTYTERIAELSISPKPTNLRRVYMLFKGSNVSSSHFNISEPNTVLPQFNRAGFTVLEWGGSELGNPELGN